MTRYSFGQEGSRIASLFVPIVNLGWYTIQAALYGHFIAQVFNLSYTGEVIAMMLSAVIMGIFAVLGIKSLAVFGYIAIPSIVFLSLGTAARSVQTIDGWQELFNYVPLQPIDLLSGITIVIGTWILSTATCIADIMRYGKSKKDVITASTIGLLGGNTLMISCGAIAGVAMNDGDLINVLLSFGLVFPSLLLLTTNIFTTNGANLYSTSLNLANSFKLNTLGIIVPPLCGIILADFYLVHRGKYINYNKATFKKWNLVPWITWAIALVCVKFIPFGLASLNGIVIGALLYALITYIVKPNVVSESKG